jgi:uncharacterized protein
MEQEKRLNSLTDFATAVGTSAIASPDTMAFNQRFTRITLNRSLIANSYEENGILQTLIDQPVDDAFRGGIEVKCDELSSDDIASLHDAINSHDILETYKQALKWMRLFGGAGILVNYGQDTRQPLQIEKIKESTPLKFYAVDRWELSGAPAGFGSIDQMAHDPTDEHPYNYYGHVLHKSNLIKLKGKEPTSLYRGQYSGWGMSELERVLKSYNQYTKHQAVTFELLDEAKVDIFSIDGFNSAIATRDGAALTARRVGVAAQIKNYQNALVLDTNDKYETKQITFAGLSEILKEIRISLACDLRMPMTKLFGLSAAGFASGEDDIENYNCMIETEIRSKVKHGLNLMLQILCQKVFGYIPERIDFEFKPLREMSTVEQSAVKNDNLTRVVNGFTNGLMPAEKAIEIINHSKVFDLPLEASEAMSLEDVKNMLGSDLPDENQAAGGAG